MLLRDPGSGRRIRGRRAHPHGRPRARPRAGIGVPGSACRSASRSPTGRTSRSTSSSRRPTAPCIGPSAPAATGSSPPDRAGIAGPATIGACPAASPARRPARPAAERTRCRRPARPVDLTSPPTPRPTSISRTTPSGPDERARADQRGPGADLPRHRRHARGQGRARLQDGRLPPRRGRDRAQPGRPRRRLPRRRRRRRSRGSARPSATRSPSSRRPAGWPSTTGCRAEVPPGLVDLLRIPGLGPKTVRQIWTELGIASMEDLRQAAEAGTLRDLRGLSARTEQLILEGIARLESRPSRMLLHRAEAHHRRVDRGPGAARRACRPSSPPARSAGAARDDRRPRPAGRDDDGPGAHRAVHRPSASSTRSSTRAATRRPSGCCAARRST